MAFKYWKIELRGLERRKNDREEREREREREKEKEISEKVMVDSRDREPVRTTERRGKRRNAFYKIIPLFFFTNLYKYKCS